METFGWLLNTAVLLFVAGLIVMYGKWLGGQVMSIKETLAKWGPDIMLIQRHSRRISEVERDLAVHCAKSHCKDDEKNSNA